MVLESRDVIVFAEEEKALWQQCFTAAPARRGEFGPSFPKVEIKDPCPGPALRANPKAQCFRLPNRQLNSGVRKKSAFAFG
jgi:hypothetical protein